ncbi:MAG TPA: MFS transporter [Rhizomicrobium sp.]|jgi:Na+/melibiose symporter-like transporter|nr:MFS transporter [Rhizomicrobium sp.]
MTDTVTRAKRTPWQIVTAYVLPSFPLAALGMPIVVHLPNYYASKEVGLGFATVGAIFGLMRILDLMIDPLTGYLSDRWRTPFGRRRPVIAIGLPILIVGLWMVFVPGAHASVPAVCFWLFVMYLGWSLVVVPHLSWGSEISTDYHERSRIYGWSQALTVAGMMGVLVIPAVLEQRHYPLSTQVMAMAIFSIVTMVPTILLCLFVVPEPEVKLSTSAGLMPTLRFLLKNSAIRRIMAVDLIESTNQGARGAMFLYFAGLALELPHLRGTLLLVYFLSGVIFTPAWIALSRRIGKHRALIASFVFGIVGGVLMLFIPAGSPAWAFAVIAFAGTSYGAPAFLIRAMMADVADADTHENNSERAGMMYAFLSMTSKLGIGWSVTIAFGFLTLLGFNPQIHNSPGAIENLRLFFILLPIGLAGLSIFTMVGYPLNEARQRELRAEIERRRAEASGDPSPLQPAPPAPETDSIMLAKSPAE